MTGYGKAEAVLEGGKLTFEIRTLNGKSADINIKSTLLPKDRELPVRQMVASSLQRGTIDVFITWEPNAAGSAKTINAALVAEYYNQVKNEVCPLIGISVPQGEVLSTILRLPDVIDSKKADIVTEENWPLVEEAVRTALDAVNDYRSKEGEALYRDVTSRVGNILALADEVEQYEAERIGTVRSRILKNLEDLAQTPDPSRFEQELVYYLEKLDINEEKVRLRQHCRYFMDTIDGEEYPGKKLGFIIQEMGREINTTGSKANHALIQKAVVRMKDELEKIREQSMNIL